MMESSNLDCPSSICSPSASILNAQSSFQHPPSSNQLYSTSIFFLHSSSSILSPKYGIFDKNVLKITGFVTKCSQAALAPLAAFSRSACTSKGQLARSKFCICFYMFDIVTNLSIQIYSMKNLLRQPFVILIKNCLTITNSMMEHFQNFFPSTNNCI